MLFRESPSKTTRTAGPCALPVHAHGHACYLIARRMARKILLVGALLGLLAGLSGCELEYREHGDHRGGRGDHHDRDWHDRDRDHRDRDHRDRDHRDHHD